MGGLDINIGTFKLIYKDFTSSHILGNCEKKIRTLHYLCVANDTDVGAVFLHLVDITVNHFLAELILPFLGSVGESLLL